MYSNSSVAEWPARGARGWRWPSPGMARPAAGGRRARRPLWRSSPEELVSALRLPRRAAAPGCARSMEQRLSRTKLDSLGRTGASLAAGAASTGRGNRGERQKSWFQLFGS